MQEELQIVLAIPGEWPTRAEMVAAIVRQGRFLFSGDIITDLRTQLSYSLDIHERDEHLIPAILFAGQHSMTPADAERLQRHTFVLYLIGPGGMAPAARDMMTVADSLLQAGGSAIQVSTSGAAHSPAYWHLLTEHRTNGAALFDTYVTFAQQGSRFFSVGMHVFGLPDALIEHAGDPNEAGELLQTFLLYTLLENPPLKDGHAFRADPQSPAYRLAYGPSDLQEPDNLMYNPYGIWRLSVITE
ncbi:DUF4261 domain-containing protein [Chloroflexia bacterium SDU3-3]|nr:DUF4261 domain-containing protein [Chloroflexia bacterium SDU3-3]